MNLKCLNLVLFTALLCFKIVADPLIDFSNLVETVSSNNQDIAVADIFFNPNEIFPQELKTIIKAGILSELRVKYRSSEKIVVLGTYIFKNLKIPAQLEVYKIKKNTRRSKTQNNRHAIVKPEQNWNEILKATPKENFLWDNPIVLPNQFLTYQTINSFFSNYGANQEETITRQKNMARTINNYFRQEDSNNTFYSPNIYSFSNNDFSSLGKTIILSLNENFINPVTQALSPKLYQGLKHISPKNMVVFLNSHDYALYNESISFSPGLSLLGQISLKTHHNGFFQNILKTTTKSIKVNNIDSIFFSSHINNNIFGSVISINIPGEIQIGNKLKAGNLSLEAELIDTNADLPLRISLKNSLNLNLKNPEQALNLVGSINFSPPDHLSLIGYLPGEWKNPFHIAHLTLFDITIEVASDLDTFLASDGFIPISDIGGRASAKTEFGQIDLGLFLSLAHDERMLVHGSFDGQVSLRDLSLFSLNMHKEKSPHISGPSINTFKEMIKNKIPDISLKKAQFFLSPRHQIIGNKEYNKGFSIIAELKIWDDHINFATKLSPKGFHALAYVPSFTIGPLKISGPKYLASNVSYDLASISRENASTGPILYLNVDSFKQEADFYIDGMIESKILGGIKGDTRVIFSNNKATFSLKAKLANKYLTNFEFYTNDYKESKDLRVKGSIEKQSLDLLEHHLRKDEIKKEGKLKQLLSQIEDEFDFSQISFDASFQQMLDNKLVFDIQFTSAGINHTINNFDIDLDSLAFSLESIAKAISKKLR